LFSSPLFFSPPSFVFRENVPFLPLPFLSRIASRSWLMSVVDDSLLIVQLFIPHPLSPFSPYLVWFLHLVFFSCCCFSLFLFFGNAYDSKLSMIRRGVSGPSPSDQQKISPSSSFSLLSSRQLAAIGTTTARSLTPSLPRKTLFPLPAGGQVEEEN